MSSTYRVLCLSHDPAVIAADGDWNRREMAEAAIAEGIEDHGNCDLMIGRYSYPLVSLGCPSSAPKRDGHAGRCCHRDTLWIDSAWLRLLLVAQREAMQGVIRVAADAAGSRCWTPARLERLRNELNLPEAWAEALKPIGPCGHPGPADDDPSNPCTLPLGHDLHRDQDGCSWPASNDAAEMEQLRMIVERTRREAEGRPGYLNPLRVLALLDPAHSDAEPAVKRRCSQWGRVDAGCEKCLNECARPPED